MHATCRTRGGAVRARALLAEAYRNLAGGTAMAGILAIVLGVALAGLSAAEARGIVGANSTIARWQNSGATVYIVSATESIDGRACEHLAQSPRVRFSGAIRADPAGLRVSALPVAPPPAWQVTPGFARLITGTAGNTAASRPDTGIILSASLAETLGRQTGSIVSTIDGDARIAGVFTVADDGRALLLSYAALEPAPATGLFDACWAEVWPPDAATVSALSVVISQNVITDEKADVTQYNTTLGTRLDATSLYSDRLTRFGALATCVIGLVLGFVSVRRRRLELASNLHAGMSRVALGTQLHLETVVWAWSSVLLAAPWAVVAATSSNPLSPGTALVAAVFVLLSGAVGASAGTALGFALTHESQLFAYFKNRA